MGLTFYYGDDRFYFLGSKSRVVYISEAGLIKTAPPRTYLLLPVEIDGFGR